ncbi:hypothetical protein [Mobiluncus sp.]|uniref:hypothetical protein n=1 Tax=Mobiluncus sp. TaxID=47293 RepID=UPI002A91E955|nr:hypothetical protein [Mobiluncus sp.]MDY6077753.1 hypothetical protein [Mobiluncus sp.]
MGRGLGICAPEYVTPKRKNPVFTGIHGVELSQHTELHVEKAKDADIYIYSLRPYVPPPDYLKAYSTQIDSVPSFKIDSLNLGSLITDNIEISDAAKLAAAAFKDFASVDNILRREDNSLTAFAKEYARRRDLIIKAGETDETYKANQAKLIDALDTAMRDRVSAFADDCVTLIGKVASLISTGDADLVQSGWVRGYQGSEKLWLSNAEERGIKADIKEMFSQVMKSGGESVSSGKNDSSVPNDNEASTGIPKDRAPQKLTAFERKALITQKYLPHMVVGNEITQDELAHALFKLGKADEVKRLNLKYSK